MNQEVRSSPRFTLTHVAAACAMAAVLSACGGGSDYVVGHVRAEEAAAVAAAAAARASAARSSRGQSREAR